MGLEWTVQQCLLRAVAEIGSLTTRHYLRRGGSPGGVMLENSRCATQLNEPIPQGQLRTKPIANWKSRVFVPNSHVLFRQPVGKCDQQCRNCQSDRDLECGRHRVRWPPAPDRPERTAERSPIRPSTWAHDPASPRQPFGVADHKGACRKSPQPSNVTDFSEHPTI